MSAPLPSWAAKLIALYGSHSANQFILYGNVNDRFVLPGEPPVLGSIYDFLRKVMMPRFDIILTYDLGNGIRIDKGAEIVTQWPALKEQADLPRAPRPAAELLTRLFRYSANLARLGQESHQIGFIMKAAHLVVPALPGALNYDLNALAMLIRDWASDETLAQHTLVTWLVAENLNDVHPLIVNSPRAAAVEIPLPAASDLTSALSLLENQFPTAVHAFAGKLE